MVLWSYIRGIPIVVVFIISLNNIIYRWQALYTSYTQGLRKLYLHTVTHSIMPWGCYQTLTEILFFVLSNCH